MGSMRNEGTLDRSLRTGVGLVLLSLLLLGPIPGWGLVGLIGLIPLVTGLIGFCPTYRLLGIDTRGRVLPSETDLGGGVPVASPRRLGRARGA